MIDRLVYVINGWKLTGKKARKMEDELCEINEDFLDDIDGFCVYDGIEYLYFGVILSKFYPDKEDNFDVVLNEKLFFDGNEKYKKFLEKYPKYAEVFKKYSNNKPPQAIVSLQVG